MLINRPYNLVPVFHHRPVALDFNNPVFHAAAGIFAGNRFLAGENKSGVPGFRLLHSPVGGHACPSGFFGDTIQQTVITIEAVLNGL